MIVAVRMLTAWAAIAVLAACETPTELNADRQRPPTDSPASSTVAEAKPTDGQSSAGPPVFDVAWNDRLDFEEWHAPLPPGQDGWPSEPPSRWPDVRVRLVLPPSVTPGDLVEYVVVLHNVSDDPVDLRPCGGYEQEVMRLGSGLAAKPVRGGTSSYRLNCDAAPILQPDESRRYAMLIEVPSNLADGEVLFRWGFVDNMPDYGGQRWVPLSTT